MANFCEFAAKPLLQDAGIRIPRGEVVHSPEGAFAAARKIGPCMVKAQVPTGKRGKAGGILPAASEAEARDAARRILGMEIGGHAVDTLLVEEQVPLREEHYVSVISDPVNACPLILFSSAGGMDIEETSSKTPDALSRIPVDIRFGPDVEALGPALAAAGSRGAAGKIMEVAAALYRIYREHDAELVEINPLAVLESGEVLALDCKLVVDDASLHRQPELAKLAASSNPTEREAEAGAEGLQFG